MLRRLILTIDTVLLDRYLLKHGRKDGGLQMGNLMLGLPNRGDDARRWAGIEVIVSEPAPDEAEPDWFSEIDTALDKIKRASLQKSGWVLYADRLLHYARDLRSQIVSYRSKENAVGDDLREMYDRLHNGTYHVPTCGMSDHTPVGAPGCNCRTGRLIQSLRTKCEELESVAQTATTRANFLTARFLNEAAPPISEEEFCRACALEFYGYPNKFGHRLIEKGSADDHHAFINELATFIEKMRAMVVTKDQESPFVNWTTGRPDDKDGTPFG